MSEPNAKRASPTAALSAIMIVLGVAMVARTISAGGGPISVGVLLGILFAAAGVGRLYISRAKRG